MPESTIAWSNTAASTVASSGAVISIAALVSIIAVPVTPLTSIAAEITGPMAFIIGAWRARHDFPCLGIDDRWG